MPQASIIAWSRAGSEPAMTRTTSPAVASACSGPRASKASPRNKALKRDSATRSAGEAQTRIMGGADTGRSAVDSQRGGIAVIGSDGTVTWTDEAWTSTDDQDDLPRVPIGANLLDAYRDYADPRTRAIASAITAVFDGTAAYFEIEHRADRESQTSFLTSVAALRGDGAGAA